jgi:RNA polymerase sigma factor (sigma-70 family)
MNENNHLSDPELVEAISENQRLEEAISQLYQEHASFARSFIMGKGATEQDADDIFQETIVSFIESVQKGKFRRESGVRTFLFSISKNLWYNEIRRRQRAGTREKVYEMEREQDYTNNQELMGNQELKNMLDQMLDELGDSCKKILKLFYFEELPMKEIVSHMQYENEQVVRNKKYKCLQKFTDKMKQNPIAAKLIQDLIRN